MDPSRNPADSSYGSYNRISVFEGLSVRYHPAPLPKRILAYVVDLSILTALFYLVFLLCFVFFWTLIGASLAGLGGSADVTFMIILIFFSLLALGCHDGYFIYYEYKKGATLGKRIFGLRVVPTDKPKLTLSPCIIRHLFRLVDCLLVLPGLISIAVTKKHQRLGDLAAGTWVIHSRRKEAEADFVYLSQERYHLYQDTLKPLPVPANQCETFLNFSYPEFITRKGKAWTQEEYAQWEAFARHYVPEAKRHSLDQTSLFLFFAEHCLQTLHQTGS